MNMEILLVDGAVVVAPVRDRQGVIEMLGKLVLLLVITVAGIAYYYSSIQSEYGEVVKCKIGSVRGFVRSSRDGRKCQSWLGVPYARAPFGDLRFSVSVAHLP